MLNFDFLIRSDFFVWLFTLCKTHSFSGFAYLGYFTIPDKQIYPFQQLWPANCCSLWDEDQVWAEQSPCVGGAHSSSLEGKVVRARCETGVKHLVWTSRNYLIEKTHNETFKISIVWFQHELLWTDCQFWFGLKGWFELLFIVQCEQNIVFKWIQLDD